MKTLLLAITCLSPLWPQLRTPFRVAISVDVDETFRGEISAQLRRELRSLPDIAVVDQAYQYKLHIVCAPVTQQSVRLGFACASAVTEQAGGLMWLAVIAQGATAENPLRRLAERLIADFETNILEPRR